MNLDLTITKKQQKFINSTATETLFGGAAGGGKSYGQLVDALLYALKYPRSKQIVFRRTYPDLEKSLIRTHMDFYPLKTRTNPHGIYVYNSSNHSGKFDNGSIIDFSYIDNETDVYHYQSAEYDVIRFDELTHFTKSMYTYMISRLRGANPYPKYMKSSTNPGGIGHSWVKERFIDLGEPNKIHECENGTRIFIPSLVQDNIFLLKSDPNYIKRLKNLSESDQKMLLYGNWDVFEGQYFTEFNRDIHVVQSFEIPSHWKRYLAMDYGLDMLAVLWIARDTGGKAYVYKELHESNLIISEAVKRIKEINNGDNYEYIYAPRDLWNRRQETGKSVADIFYENGLNITRTSVDRVDGWFATKEWLKVFTSRNIETGEEIKDSNLKIFSNCLNLIKNLPQLLIDEKNPNDVSTEPHELTHIADALRYFCVNFTYPTEIENEKTEEEEREETNFRNYINYGVG